MKYFRCKKLFTSLNITNSVVPTYSTIIIMNNFHEAILEIIIVNICGMNHC